MARRNRWQWFDIRENTKALQRRGGLYALYDIERRLIYIGSTGNIRSRVTDHRNRLRPHVCYVKVLFLRGAWYLREQRLVRRLRPIFNVRITKRNLRSPND